MQTFRSHGYAGDPEPPRERVSGAAPRGHDGHVGRYGRGRPGTGPEAADAPDTPVAVERYWVDQEFEDPFLE